MWRHKNVFKIWLVSHILVWFLLGFWYGTANADFICSDESSRNTNVGVGKTILLAEAAMWENCVNQLTIEYKRTRGDIPSEDRVVLFIDSCINRVCTSIEGEK